MNIFDKIKQLCVIRGISISDLMKSIGKSGIGVYAGWRQRNCIPRADDLYLIAKKLSVPMEYFFEDSENNPPSQKEGAQKKLDMLTNQEIETLNNMPLEELQTILSTPDIAASICRWRRFFRQ